MSKVSPQQRALLILMNLQQLHSPCKSEQCQVSFEHCSGCQEAYPCKSARVLQGKSVAQVYAEIDANNAIIEQGPVTVYGDQKDDEEGEPDVLVV